MLSRALSTPWTLMRSSSSVRVVERIERSMAWKLSSLLTRMVNRCAGTCATVAFRSPASVDTAAAASCKAEFLGNYHKAMPYRNALAQAHCPHLPPKAAITQNVIECLNGGVIAASLALDNLLLSPLPPGSSTSSIGALFFGRKLSHVTRATHTSATTCQHGWTR